MACLAGELTDTVAPAPVPRSSAGQSWGSASYAPAPLLEIAALLLRRLLEFRPRCESMRVGQLALDRETQFQTDTRNGTDASVCGVAILPLCPQSLVDHHGFHVCQPRASSLVIVSATADMSSGPPDRNTRIRRRSPLTLRINSSPIAGTPRFSSAIW